VFIFAQKSRELFLFMAEVLDYLSLRTRKPTVLVSVSPFLCNDSWNCRDFSHTKEKRIRFNMSLFLYYSLCLYAI